MVWLVASVSFGFGWATRAATARPMDSNQDQRRIILDWGAAQRLLDLAQVRREDTSLAPRVRWLLDQLFARSGWPAGDPSDQDRFGPDHRFQQLESDDVPVLPPFRID